MVFLAENFDRLLRDKLTICFAIAAIAIVSLWAVEVTSAIISHCQGVH